MKGVDTNILVYAFDLSCEEKRMKCKKIVWNVFNGIESAAITNQILAEFFIAVTKKIEKPLSVDEAKAIIGAILSSENWKVFNYTAETLFNTLDNNISHFWDALIARTFLENGIREILTENTADFSNLGIMAIKPF